MKNIIIKSAFATLGVVAGCAVVIFAVLSFGFPSTLCGWSEQLGNYGFAVKYASLSFSYSGEIEDLARCAEDSILSENDGYIIEYCTQLADADGFDEYCALRDEEMQELPSFSYRQFIYGSAACAVYRGEGNIDLAIGYGAEALKDGENREEFSGSLELSSFPINNAMGTLALEVIQRGDSAAAQKMTQALSGVSSGDAAEQKYLGTILSALSEL